MSEEKNPDAVLARGAWKEFKYAMRALVAAAGIGIVFATRVTCGCDPAPPEGLDFEWYGNHCGPGYGDPESPAIDSLDERCKKHDAAIRLREEKEVTPPGVEPGVSGI